MGMLRHRRHVVVVNWKDSVHPAAGGAEVFCEAVARELVQLGLKVTLLASRPDGAPARSEVDGYTIRRRGGTYTVYLFALLWLLRHRRSVDAVIDSQNGIPFFTPLAVRRTTPVALLIHHVHQEQFALYFSPRMAAVGRWLERRGSQLVYRDRAVCAVSPSSRTEIRRKLGLRGPIFVVPNGSAGAVPPVAGDVRAAVPTITCVGRLVPHKRWDLLLTTVAELRDDLPDLHVDLVGTGPELDRLRALRTELGLDDTVTLHGFVSAQERDRLLARAWLTVSTSVGEGWGLSIIEAASQGVPAVALDVPGLRDSVRDGITGWLCEQDALAATVRAALLALADPVRAADHALRCRDWADSLQWSATAERFHAVIAAEAVRLGGPRPRAVDTATIVTLDHAAAAQLDLGALEPTDQTTFCRDCLADTRADSEVVGTWRVLLHGKDEHQALRFLDRAGVDTRLHDVELSLCRPHELLTWRGDGVGHSYLATFDGGHCPRQSRTVLGPAAHVASAGGHQP
ncbi:glycosyltransferase family 4 protein [Jatrophihabitans endophyticus]|uniref:glycosyltransferase family 4 protein n=1 Tax=Jatrophihabitans endophyticus TaxID=1206085 RepID=UPI001A05F0D1|nr:glycosyltransferase family 4 protein [Jatrophihabitans endophyticus]MBE7187645.1 glycosyltransferase family 4 protein [Jatrophihabitans endophyticus]